MAEQTDSLIARALYDTLVSPNQSDPNEEPANVVDALYYIGRGLRAIAKALDELPAKLAAIDRGE